VLKDIDLGYKKALKKLISLKGTTIQAGILKDAGTNEDGEYIADYANANEYGLGVQERSFMRSTYDEQEAKWNKDADKIVEYIIKDPDVNVDNLIAILGEKMVGDIKEKIASNIPPPNSDATIKRKKSSRTLIDSGVMRNSIEYEIKKDV